MITIETAKVYKVAGYGLSSERFFTKKAAYSHLAWRMISEKHGGPWDEDAYGNKMPISDKEHEFRYKLHKRLVRWLRFNYPLC